MLTVLKRPDFRLLFIGTAASLIGDSLMFLTLAIWVKDLTGSDGAAGMTMLFLGAPVLLAPLAGMFVDRVRFRPFLICANLGNAVVLLPLAFVTGADDVWLIYLTAALLGLGSVLDNPALNGLRKLLLPEKLLAEANGATQTVQQGLRLIGPIAGAGIYLAFGGLAVALVDAASFLVAAGAIALLRVRQPRHEAVTSHWFAELTAGFRFIGKDPALRRAVSGLFLVAASIGAIEVIAFAITDAGLGREPEFVSVIVTAMGVGGLTGGILAARIVNRIGELAAQSAAMLATAACFAVWAAPSLIGVLTAAVLLGLALPVLIVADNTLIQKRSPQHLIGRISAASDVCFTVPQLASLATGAILVTVVDFRVMLAVMAGVMCVAGGVAFLGRRLTPPQVAVAESPDVATVKP